MMRIAGADFEQRLGRRDHLDQPAIVQQQRIAAAERNGVFQVEQEFQPAGAGHDRPPPMSIVKVEHDRVGRNFGKTVLPFDLRRPDHAQRLSVSVATT